MKYIFLVFVGIMILSLIVKETFSNIKNTLAEDIVEYFRKNSSHYYHNYIEVLLKHNNPYKQLALQSTYKHFENLYKQGMLSIFEIESYYSR